ncbi:DNA repair protein RAD5A-like isoform X2 [Salvia splendens]|uniref:DNA repair protein RAD5A-like isoform X2 n=1 Tax=Salvia splendens TaxID=180675 RepID=UPI001C279C78|nr:DNA repair protein RAD5A-like isoform X2 [Salvia splendens]
MGPVSFTSWKEIRRFALRGVASLLLLCWDRIRLFYLLVPCSKSANRCHSGRPVIQLRSQFFTPLPTLFKLFGLIPFKKVEFTPGDLYARKRPLNSEDSSFLPPTISHINKFKSASSGNENNGENEESVSENDRDNIVGVTDRSELEEMEPPSTLLCELHPYQKQALSWMIQLERGHCGDEVTTTMHPCWDAYQLADRIHGGIQQLKNKQSCGFIALDKLIKL